MKRTAILLASLFLCVCMPSFSEASFSEDAASQTEVLVSSSSEQEEKTESKDKNTKESFPCRINKITYNSRGKTKPFALDRAIAEDTTKIFATEQELNDYVQGLKQQVINTRLLEDVTAEYHFTSEENGVHLADVTVSFSDSKHVLGLPKPGYDSNSGAELKLKLKDTNFLGLMNPLNFDINMNFGDKDEPDNWSKVYTGINFDYELPFNVWALENSWSNEFSFSWNIGTDAEGKLNAPNLSYTTGLTVGVPFGFNNKVNLSMKQSVIRNNDYIKYGDEFYFVEGASASLPLTIGVIGDLTPVTYTPSTSFTYNWDHNGISMENEDLLSPKFSVAHEVATSHINWDGNFRNGFSVTANQSIGWNFQTENFVSGINSKVQLFKGFKHLALASQLYFFAYLNDTEKIGPFLRGTRDNQLFVSPENSNDYVLKTPLALVFSLDMPVRIVTTDWLGWGCKLFGTYESVYEKTPSWLKWATWLSHKVFSIADFELQLSPFVDIGLMKNRRTESIFLLQEGFYDAGAEILVYPAKWKSYVVRISVGFDLGTNLLSSALDNSWKDSSVKGYEIFFGLGRQF